MGRGESFAWTREAAHATDTAADFARAAWIAPQAGIAVYGLLTIAYLLARLAVGERWRAVAWANNFVPWLALVALVMVLLALFSRWRWALIGLQLPILVAFGVWYGGLLLPRDPSPVAPGALPLRVAAYNMHGKMSEPAQVAEMVLALNADVIGLNEVGNWHARDIERATADAYPYQVWYPRPTVHGVGLLSRYPVLEEAVVMPQSDSNLHLRAVLDVNGTPVTVFVAHPPSPTAPFSALHYNDGPRNTELAVLREWVAAERGPVLVLCDCNMSDQSDAYRAMDALLDDAHRAAGRGFGFTFPYGRTFPPPLVRIDYVWYGEGFTALDVYPAEGSGSSDHRPVVAELALDAEGS